jgi:hypothetical protein
MKFANNRRWWTRDVGRNPSLAGRCLPHAGLGGLFAAFMFLAWRFEPMAENPTAAAPPVGVSADFRQLPAVRISLRSDAAGHLAAIYFNGRPVRDDADLRGQIKMFLGPDTDATVEAELDCDGKLRYEDMQRTIQSISGYPSPDSRTQVPLVDRVKFVPRRGRAN